MRHTLIIPRRNPHPPGGTTGIAASRQRVRREAPERWSGKHRPGDADRAGFFDALLNTKPPHIFAESAVFGDGDSCFASVE